MMFGRQGIARVAAVLIMSGALVGSTPAFAAAPALSVTPSTGLSDGQSVTVTGSGFPAGDAVAAVQCNVPEDPAKISCNFPDNAQTTTDSDGGFSAALTVRAQFDGVNPITGAPAGHVDCTVAPGCGVLAGSLATPEVFAGPAPISFTPSAR
ncbi:enediyne antibiotic chromoprotein [Lentzea sp. NPDC005914]|uniref:enediyne antibiotic chromoprotein n=1 Tax=Lentzea sp. NPDC005914 TaxID=3154572 RepID=UPI0033EB5369